MTAAIYARQSKEKKDSLSIAAQVEKCRAFCSMRGWDAAEYLEPGLSGKDTKRPQFQKMMQDIRAGQIGAVVAYKYDRIGRNLREILNVIYELEQLGCKYVSINENFDTSTPIGRAAVSNILTFAQFERETIAERLKDNFRYRIALGRFPGGHPPYGYRLEKGMVADKPGNVMVADETEAPILQEIYRRYLDGESLRRIAFWLNETGARSKGGAAWNFSHVARTLRNPAPCAATPDAYRYFDALGCDMADEPAAYTGDRGLFAYAKKGAKSTNAQFFGGERIIIVGPHAPLIDADDWLAAQRRLSEAKSKGKFGTSSLTWLSGLARCSVCGGLMNVHCVYKNKPFLQCANYTHKRTCTSKRCHMAGAVETLVEAEIEKYLAETDFSKIQADEPIRAPADTDIKLLEVEKKIGNIVDAIADSGAGEKHLSKRLDELERERTALLEQAGADSVENHTLQRANKKLAEFLAGKFSALPISKKRGLAALLISSLTIAPDKTINIEWAYSN